MVKIWGHSIDNLRDRVYNLFSDGIIFKFNSSIKNERKNKIQKPRWMVKIRSNSIDSPRDIVFNSHPNNIIRISDF